MNIRSADFKGSWYPAGARECQREIEVFLNDPDIQKPADRHYIGGIVPHAGWFFSGSIACNVICCLKSDDPVDVIAVFGRHLHPHSPNYIMTQGAWETPFGELEIDTEITRQLTKSYSFEIETAHHYSQDNTIELQLPFIKYFFGDVKIIPIGVPPHRSSFEIGKTVVKIAEELGLRIKIIGSTDLTHYGHNYGFVSHGTGREAVDWVVQHNDKNVIQAMLALEPEKVLKQAMDHQNACCAGAAATAISAAKQIGAQTALSIAYRTSYDKSPGDSFVGYVGILFK